MFRVGMFSTIRGYLDIFFIYVMNRRKKDATFLIRLRRKVHKRVSRPPAQARVNSTPATSDHATGAVPPPPSSLKRNTRCVGGTLCTGAPVAPSSAHTSRSTKSTSPSRLTTARSPIACRSTMAAGACSPARRARWARGGRARCAAARCGVLWRGAGARRGGRRGG